MKSYASVVSALLAGLLLAHSNAAFAQSACSSGASCLEEARPNGVASDTGDGRPPAPGAAVEAEGAAQAVLAHPQQASAPSGFVFLAPGTFAWGAPIDEAGGDRGANRERVTLTRGFYLQTTEVNQGAWQVQMGSNPSHFSSCGSGCPVDSVSWLEAIGYANALSRAEGLRECYDGAGNVQGGGSVYDCTGYRLPTESEWEYAAAVGATGAHLGSVDAPPPFRDDTEIQTRPVGTLDANAWGLHDMLGNVWEWTHDWGGAERTTATDPAGPSTGSRRMIRGGSWDYGPGRVRPTNRYSNAPSFRYRYLGFRLARSAL